MFYCSRCTYHHLLSNLLQQAPNYSSLYPPLPCTTIIFLQDLISRFSRQQHWTWGKLLLGLRPFTPRPNLFFHPHNAWPHLHAIDWFLLTWKTPICPQKTKGRWGLFCASNLYSSCSFCPGRCFLLWLHSALPICHLHEAFSKSPQ